MRRIVTILIVLAVLLGLGAAAGYFLLGWWRPQHEISHQENAGFEAESEPSTLPEVLKLANDSVKVIKEKVHDYSATILKREFVGGALVSKWMFIKFREEPFSAYLNFLETSSNDANGREVIYVQGKNDSKLVVHTPGLQDKTIGTMQLPPDGFLAMQGERHPITHIGLANLCHQLIQRGESAGDPAHVDVKRFPKGHLNGRPCTVFQVMYPVKEKGLWGYLARIFLDNEYHFPTRVEVYELPADRKKKPQLVEEYTYLNIKLNNGYTDLDFDPKNRQYKYP